MSLIEIPAALPSILRQHPQLPVMANIITGSNWDEVIACLTALVPKRCSTKKDERVLQMVFITGNPGVPTERQRGTLTELFVLYPLVLVVSGAPTTRLTAAFPTNVVTSGQLNRDGFLGSRAKMLL